MSIIDELKKLPEVNLRIIALAWRLLDDNGDLDMAKAADALDEVNEACTEAAANARDTEIAVSCLKVLAHSPD